MFFLLLCISQTGFYAAFLFQQYQVKASARAHVLSSLPLSSLIRIEQQDGLQWEEAQKEFYFDGNLYDVVKICQESDKTVFYCVNDKKEMQLLTSWANAEHIENNSPYNNHSHQQLKIVFDEFDWLITYKVQYKLCNSSTFTSFISLFFPSGNENCAFRPPQV